MQADVTKLKAAAERADGDIDILLTCEWPHGVTAGAAPLSDGANCTNDDPVAAELAVAIRPRLAHGLRAYLMRSIKVLGLGLK